MENAYCIKKYRNENGSHGEMILKEFHKAKSVKCPNPKESDSNVENISNNEKNSKNAKEGNFLEIYQENSKEKIKMNDKYLSIMNGAIKLETNKNKESEVEIRYIPGYGDIIQIILYDKDKKQMFLDESENSINLVEYPTDRSQFLIIPELTKK